MITVNNILYVKKGSSEDNGTYTHYYYTSSVTNTYSVIYEGNSGTLTTTTVVYMDVDTDQVLTNDYFTWSIIAGVRKYSGVCRSKAEEDTILSYVVDTGSTDNTSNNNKNTNSDTGSNTNTVGKNDDNSNIYTGDSSTNNYGLEDDTDTGIFDNTISTSDSINIRDNLPLGANINNPDILGYDYTETEGNTPRENNFSNKGTTYPIIRINDHYFQDNEILFFSMETGFYKDYTEYEKFQMPIAGFIPTMKLIVTTSNQGLLKRNHVKQGDKCAVFFTNNHSMVKSMRCDFRITNVVTDKMDQNRNERFMTLIITGELYVPDLYNEELRYNFNGSSRDAMMDAAKRLRLSFFFCDPDDTSDIMVWCNCKSPFYFILDLTTHAWKNANAFFESWIDPRYGLSFQNINRLLGEDGLDEAVDATFWINTFINNRGADGKSAEKSAKDKALTDKPQSKILTNIPSDDESATVYHVNKWRLINNALEIQDSIGLNCKMQYESVNPGLLTDNSNYSVEFSMCINRTKFDPEKSDNDFYVLLGPARNMTYASADATMGTSETESSNKAEAEKVVNQLSDGDDAQILATDGNMMSSGNTHKFYEVAYEHNMRNLLLLLKQYIEVELNGANLTLVRGEKLPIMLMDLNKADLVIRTSLAKTKLEELIYEAESGWYIIDGIEWVFDPNEGSGTGTSWRTNVKMVRREWPVPGKDKSVTDENGNSVLSALSKLQVLVNIGNGQYVKRAYCDAILEYDKSQIMGYVLEDVTVTGTDKSGDNTGTLYDENGSETVSSDLFNLDMIDQYVTKSDTLETSTIPLTGLKSYMKQIYKAIAEAADNNVKLVSARRWAVDEYGNKVDGNAYIKKYNYYKCMNAIGEVMYFKKNNSRHLYGEAIDIINNGSGFNELMTNVIMKNGTILLLMYDNGVSAYIELSTDDLGATTKHYHIGTDIIKQKEFWASVQAILGSDKIPGTMITFSNYTKNNNTAEAEITKNDIDELSLDKEG